VTREIRGFAAVISPVRAVRYAFEFVALSALGPSASVLAVGYSVVDVADLEGEGPGGAVRKVRRALGARAFGFNYFTLGPGIIGREHDHTESGMEEVYFVVGGSGTMRVDGEEIELRPGIFLRVDGESTRVPEAGPDGLEFVTFGRPLTGDYEPPAWG
jgi:mannose-6-phosphate isomerase-like protein (cupin superfamily)